MKFFLIICFAVFFSSCGRIIMTVYGIKNPDIEDSLSLMKYCDKKGISTNNLYTLSAEDNIKVLGLTGGSIPEIKIFNQKGSLIPYANSKFCNGAAFSFIDSLNSNKNFEEDTSLIFSDLANKLRNLSGNLSIPEQNNETDYYIFIFWSRWTGRLNKTHVIPWENQALSNPNARVMVFKVNLDLQKYWNLSKEKYKTNLERSFKIKVQNGN